MAWGLAVCPTQSQIGCGMGRRTPEPYDSEAEKLRIRTPWKGEGILKYTAPRDSDAGKTMMIDNTALVKTHPIRPAEVTRLVCKYNPARIESGTREGGP